MMKRGPRFSKWIRRDTICHTRRWPQVGRKKEALCLVHSAQFTFATTLAFFTFIGKSEAEAMNFLEKKVEEIAGLDENGE
jgi:hypothetical protein